MNNLLTEVSSWMERMGYTSAAVAPAIVALSVLCRFGTSLLTAFPEVLQREVKFLGAPGGDTLIFDGSNQPSTNNDITGLTLTDITFSPPARSMSLAVSRVRNWRCVRSSGPRGILGNHPNSSISRIPRCATLGSETMNVAPGGGCAAS